MNSFDPLNLHIHTLFLSLESIKKFPSKKGESSAEYFLKILRFDGKLFINSSRETRTVLKVSSPRFTRTVFCPRAPIKTANEEVSPATLNRHLNI